MGNLSTLWGAVLVTVALIGLGPAGSQAQDRAPVTLVPLDITPGEAARDYRRAARGVRVDVIYVDRLDGPVPRDAAPRFEPPEEEQDTPRAGASRNAWTAVALVVVIAVLAAAFKFGGPGQVSFRALDTRRKTAVRDAGAGALAAPEEVAGPVDGFLARIRAMADRRAALHLLATRVLSDALTAQGGALRRSDTARDVLARVPGDWRHAAQLGKIVRAEELVQFGGRTLSDALFEECLTLAKPILKAGT